jgi:hypothetical protein
VILHAHCILLILIHILVHVLSPFLILET